MIKIGDTYKSRYSMLDYGSNEIIPAGTLATVVAITIDTKFGWAVVRFDHEDATKEGVLMYLEGDQTSFEKVSK